MEKHNKNIAQGYSIGMTGSLETAKDWLHETEGTMVQNPDQNNQIHKQSLGTNAHR